MGEFFFKVFSMMYHITEFLINLMLLLNEYYIKFNQALLRHGVR